MNIVDSWILNRDNNYAHDCEELSQLELMGKLGRATNEVIVNHNKLTNEVRENEKDIEDKLIDTNKKKVSHSDMLDIYKNDKGNHLGAWQGITSPAMSEPGIQGQVLKNIDDIETINNQMQEMYYNLNNFKKLESDVDDTDRIQRAINYCIEKDYTLLIPHGEYIVSSRGEKLLPFVGLQRKYCILAENKKVKILMQGTIKVDLSSEEIRPNIFTFIGCEVNFNGGTFIGLKNKYKSLYEGNSIILDRCKNSTIEKVKSYNTNGSPLLMQSVSSTVKDCYYENTSKTMAYASACFGIYGSNNCSIENCISFGGCGDGDISLYGDGFNNRVINCRSFNSLHDLQINPLSTHAQGICIDAGQNNCTVQNNYVYGYYYGIDVKTNIEACLVQNNIVERCKVGIASRNGEAEGPVVNVTIDGNLIINGGNGDKYSIANYDTIGIYAQRTGSADIKNNTFKCDSKYTISQNSCAILVHNDHTGLNGGYYKDININNNSFINESGLGANVKQGFVVDIRIVENSKAQIFNIINNNFSGGFGSKLTPFIRVDKCGFLNIKGNTFGRNDCIDGSSIVSEVIKLEYKNNTNEYNKGSLVVLKAMRVTCNNNNFNGTSDYKNPVAITGDKSILLNNVYINNGVNDGTLCHVLGNLVGGGNVIEPFTDRGASGDGYLFATGDKVLFNNTKI